MIDLSVYIADNYNLEKNDLNIIHLGYFSVCCTREHDFDTYYSILNNYSYKYSENSEKSWEIECRTWDSYVLLREDFENNNKIFNSILKEQIILESEKYNIDNFKYLIFNILH